MVDQSIEWWNWGRRFRRLKPSLGCGILKDADSTLLRELRSRFSDSWPSGGFSRRDETGLWKPPEAYSDLHSIESIQLTPYYHRYGYLSFAVCLNS